jgi:transcriptional regulator with XRE-family HTH domain
MTHLFSVDRPTGESSADMNTTVKVPPRQRLSAERIRRRWSQLEVADQLGTTPGNVSRWERGLTSPGPYFRSKLCELFGRSAQELGLTWDESGDSPDHNMPASSSLVASFLWDTLPRSNPLFAGRKDLLVQLRTLLRPDNTKVCPATLAISSSNGPNNPEQEHVDQGRLVQAITQWLQTQQNWMLIVDNAESVVLVASNNTVCS